MIRIISSARMGHGTLQAKFEPLSKVGSIQNIYILRKEKGPYIDKVHYILLPKICKVSIFNFVLTPLILSYYAIKLNVSFILSYHFIPHAFFGYFASLITRKPHVLCQTGLYIQKYALNPKYKHIIKGVAKSASYVNVPGNLSRDFWISLGVSDKKVNVLHSTIDTDYYTPKSVEKEYDFIFVGRLAPEKEIGLLLKALSELHKKGNKASIVIVGDGREKNKLIDMSKEFGIDDYVDFVGFQNDVRTWLYKSSFSVLTSRSEGLPTALMQAMACGVICISSDVGNISDMIKHNQNGYLFEAMNLQELVCCMEDAINNNPNHAEMINNARNTIINNHSYKSAIVKWEQMFSDPSFGI